MGRGVIEPERPVKVTDLLIRQKAEAMILWAYTALRQFPRHERHVLAAEIAARAAAEAQWEQQRVDLVAALQRGEAEVAGLRERLQTHWWAKLYPSRQGVA